MNRSDLSSRSTWGAIIIACGLTLAPLGCSPVETAIIAEPGVSFSLPVGKTAALRGTETRLTFREVRSDSRCAIDVTCIWAGDATIALVISRNGAADETRILSLSITPPGNEASSGNLRIRFVGLAPVPRQSNTNTRAYVAEFVVDQL